MHELGLLDAFLALPHQEVAQLAGQIGDEPLPGRRLHATCRPAASSSPSCRSGTSSTSSPARRAAIPTFHLRMQTEATGLIEDGGRVAGVRATTPDGALEIRADLVVGADGRHSRSARAAGPRRPRLGAPIDVLWMRLPRRAERPRAAVRPLRRRPHLRHDQPRRLLAVRASSSPRAALDAVRGRGLPAFRAGSPRSRPFAADRVDELADWDDVKLLTVAVDRLRHVAPPGPALHRRRRPRHVAGRRRRHQPRHPGRRRRREHAGRAAARGPPRPRPTSRAVQRRRELPTRMTQRLQVLVQNRVIGRVLGRRRAAQAAARRSGCSAGSRSCAASRPG